MESGHEMAYAILVISFTVLIASFFIDKIDFKKDKKKNKHSHD